MLRFGLSRLRTLAGFGGVLLVLYLAVIVLGDLPAGPVGGERAQPAAGHR